VIRVGFLHPHYGEAWLGGVSYLRNLLGAVAAAPECGVRPVLLTQSARPAGFEGVDVVRSLALRLRHQLVSRGVLKRLGWDPLDRILAHHRLDVLSHSGVLGMGARTPALAWIPDLQHRVLPGFFSPEERAARDAAIAASLRQAARVIVSSQTAQSDLERFFPGCAEKLRVLRFIDRTLAAAEAPPREALEVRYRFTGRYFLLPNQYWAHKNHQRVLEALSLLRREGREVLVLSTGSRDDHRNPDHFDRLMRLRAELGLETSYRVLGVVPHIDLAGLLREAAAVINPSLFEGWSTSVEEAKSLGKRVLLSDIAVHREQAPERGVYFDPARADRLAEAMWAAWQSTDLRQEETAAKRAAEALPARQREFAGMYVALVREVVTTPSSARAPANSGSHRGSGRAF
jgi:glycosyltransferase involved in cell wall biosynthesis